MHHPRYITANVLQLLNPNSALIIFRDPPRLESQAVGQEPVSQVFSKHFQEFRGVSAHSSECSPRLYSQGFANFSPAQRYPPTRAGRVTLILNDSRVRQDCKCLPFNPELVGLWCGHGRRRWQSGEKKSKLRRLLGTPFCNL